MRLLVISAAFPPLRSGGSDFALRLCSELAQAGQDVHCLTTDSNNHAAPLNFELHAEMKAWDWPGLKKCLKLVQRVQPDVIDIHFTGWVYNDHPMITLLPAALKRNYPHIRIVTHIESLGGVKRDRSSWLTRAMRFLTSWRLGRKDLSYDYGSILRDSDALIVLNESDQRELCLRSPQSQKKYTLIPPPPIMPICDKNFDLQSLRQSLATPDELVLSYYGYVYQGKGLEHLIEALSLLTHRAARLIVIGHTPENYVFERAQRSDYLDGLKELAERLGVGDRIFWAGYSPAGSTRSSELLRASDMCVLPFENGVKLNNSSFSFAAAHGIPIITTRAENTEEAFRHSFNAYLCEPCNPQSLADAISTIAQDHDLQKKLAHGALAMSEQWFSWPKAIEQTINIFRASAKDQPFEVKVETHA